jgi:hypothetical protein
MGGTWPLGLGPVRGQFPRALLSREQRLETIPCSRLGVASWGQGSMVAGSVGTSIYRAPARALFRAFLLNRLYPV